MSDKAVGKAAATVHVVDDDAGMRQSLRMLMERASFPVEVYDSAEDFLEEADLKSPGCIVLDLRMPGIGGMELLQRLRSMRHDMPVIIMSGHADVPTAVRGMTHGAVNVLQKPCEPRELLASVKNAINISLDLRRQRGEERAVEQRFASVTSRERAVLKLLVAGRSNKQMALDLGISIKTVANHRASLMAKTQALNGADLVHLCTIAGIIPSS